MRWSRLRLRVRTTYEQSRSTPLSDLSKPEQWRPPSARYRHAKQRREAAAAKIANSFIDGPWTVQWMTLRAAYDFELVADGWLLEMANRAVEEYPTRPDPSSPDHWRRFLVDIGCWIDAALDQGAQRGGDVASIEARLLNASELGKHSGSGEYRWDVPEFATTDQLADQLNLDDRSLLWFADPSSFERTARDENLRHYDYHWIPKRSGGARLLEAPKQNLAYMQRWILRDILNQVPPHNAAHGFVKGRSIQTFASPHTARDWVLRVDLKDFFPSVFKARVDATFQAVGYPREVARMLGGLTTNATPSWVFASCDRELGSTLRERLRNPHLPQGAPTSPALANLAAFGLDVRMSALAERFDARYTRYADDLAFSGNSSARSGASREEVDRLIEVVYTIITEEGFSVNRSKTRVRRSHQRQVLTGMVVNKHLNLHRRDLDRLRAELHEAVVKGPAQANRTGHGQYRSHLQGRLGFVQATNPAKARKLWSLYDQIDWST